MDRVLRDYLPPVVREMREMQAITDGQQDALVTIWTAVADIWRDQFVEEATENGVRRWERILKLVPKGSEALEERKFRIKTRLNEQLPFTLPALKQQLATLCGASGYAVSIEKGTYILTVKVELTAKTNFEEVATLLRRMVPAQIVVRLILKYNKHRLVGQLTNRELSAWRQQEIRDEILTQTYNQNSALRLLAHHELNAHRHKEIRKKYRRQSDERS